MQSTNQPGVSTLPVEERWVYLHIFNLIFILKNIKNTLLTHFCLQLYQYQKYF